MFTCRQYLSIQVSIGALDKSYYNRSFLLTFAAAASKYASLNNIETSRTALFGRSRKSGAVKTYPEDMLKAVLDNLLGKEET
ncbi:MAG: hypothetical protein HZT40_04265 [Candidatus Thiothrix singaporensis]|uniref:Uncharacterized protein n=1 Tax=Candidatus Thiothrix singaporensis TaxID=2799669 RepID=A0A7L6APF4_9GAMM|nr:MAG: hypothetical protein HZT40_04265 [Candidatus Thiothrix singaporensis]